MRKVLLDTDILSEYLKGRDQNVIRNADAYTAFHAQFTITSVTVYEVTLGLASKNATSKLLQTLQWFRNQEEILPVEQDYLTAAYAKANARLRGNTVELPDCLIACVASRLKMPLVTGNTNDFRAIQDAGVSVELQNWRLL